VWDRLFAHRLLRAVIFVLSLVGVVDLLVIANGQRGDSWRSAWFVVGWPFAFAIAVAATLGCLARSSPWTRGIARWSGLAYIGLISFGVYLFHPFIIDAFANAWFKNGATVSTGLFVAVVLAATIVVSMMFHYGLERPAMVWGRRISGGSSERARTSHIRPIQRSVLARPRGGDPNKGAVQEQSTAAATLPDSLRPPGPAAR
jgi:peptidoglycan/LPS O-acetylase OafA/YrhL